MWNVGTYTLAQAIFNRTCVYVVCQRCGHFGLISFEQSLKLGQSTPVAELEKRYRCRVCKAREARIQPDRPMTGERVCPKCGTQLWRPAPIDYAGPKCSRCGRLMRR